MYAFPDSVMNTGWTRHAISVSAEVTARVLLPGTYPALRQSEAQSDWGRNLPEPAHVLRSHDFGTLAQRESCWFWPGVASGWDSVLLTPIPPPLSNVSPLLVGINLF